MLGSFKRLSAMCLAGMARHSPLELGRWRLKIAALEQVRRHGARIGRRTVRTREGFVMELDLADWVDQHIYATGEYEDYTAALFGILVPAGGVVIDVGANIGFFSLLASRLVGTRGRVIAFEPVPFIRERLRRNVLLNRASEIDIRDEAVSDSASEVTIYKGPTSNSGMSSLRTQAGQSGGFQVRSCKLDETLSALNRIDLIKMDVEGAEGMVLRGMGKIVKRFQPDVIAEVSDDFLKELGDSANWLRTSFADLGYRCFEIDWNGIREIDIEQSLPQYQFNALFTVRDALPSGITLL